MIDTDNLQELARVVPALDDVPVRVREALIGRAETVRLHAGARVFDDGDACTALVAVLEGAVRVSKLSESGRELLLYHVRPGDFCVLTVTCLLGRSPYPAQGIAEGDVLGVRIPGDLFETLIETSPAFRRTVFASMGGRLDTLLHLVEEVAFQRLDQRLAARLLRRDLDGERPIGASHQELADDLGSSREIVSRILESFAVQGWIELGRRRIEIRDPEALRRLG